MRRPPLCLALLLLGLSACTRSEAPAPAEGAAEANPPPPSEAPAPAPGGSETPVPEDSALASEAPAPPPGRTVAVDFETGRIGEVDMDATADVIARQIGDEAVREEQTQVEGEPRTVFTFALGGGEVRKSAYVVSYDDPRYRTAEGLGVGSTVGDFGERYGHTEITPGEEGQCRGAWFNAGRRVRACVPPGCSVSSCRVTRVLFVAERAHSAQVPDERITSGHG